jgi:flavin-dependent dehydrogenase
MRRGTDVFVVGGGPAGLAVAIAARQKGFRVVVADGAEPPIDKPCGEGLLPESLAALQDLGVRLGDNVGWHLRGIRFLQSGSHVHAKFPNGYGIGIRRPLLHEILVAKAADCGVKFLWKTPVSSVSGEGVQLSRDFVTARWIIGADGGGSRVRRWSGLDANSHRKHRQAVRRHYRVATWTDYMEVYWGERAQAYVTPISAEEVCIVVLAEKSEDADFERAIANWPELKNRLADAQQGSRERGAITSMHTLRRVTAGNVALAGDASGGVDAITGEGLRLSFRQALALAEAMECGDLNMYERAHRELALKPTAMSRLMLMLGRNNALRERTIRGMAAKPGVFEKLLAIHVGETTPGQWISSGISLGWQFLGA